MVNLTKERVLKEENIQRLIDKLLELQDKEDITCPALRRQLAETEKSIANIMKAIEAGIFTSTTKERLEELETQKRELAVSIVEAELKKPKLTRDHMENWFDQFRYGDPNSRDYQRQIIDSFVNAIFVYEDKLIITYNYDYGTDTITFADIDAFLGSDLVSNTPPNKDTIDVRFLGKRKSIVSLLYGLILCCFTHCREIVPSTVIMQMSCTQYFYNGYYYHLQRKFRIEFIFFPLSFHKASR